MKRIGFLLLALFLASAGAWAQNDKLENYGHYQQIVTGYGSTGAGGWSAPDGVILGGGFKHLDGGTVFATFPGEPNTEYPHHTYGDDEYGWNVYNGGTSGDITIYGLYSDMPEGYGIIKQTISGFSPAGWAGWSVPAGKVILGGGYEANGPVAVSAPAGPNSVWPHYTYGAEEYGWVVRSAGATEITIYAIYADEPEGYEIVQSDPMSYSATGAGGWSVQNGKVVTGGGFELPGPANASYPGLPGYTTPGGYTYDDDEYGWVVLNGGVGGEGYIYVIYANQFFPVEIYRNGDFISGHETIQAAINAAEAGDVIEVAAGIYEEALEILTDNLTLVSTDGAEQTIIDAGDATNAIEIGEYDKDGIHPSDVTIDGFTVKGWKQRGIGQRNGNGTISVLNNIVIPPTDGTSVRGGIIISGGDGSLVKGNTITGAVFGQEDWYSGGIQLWGTENAIVEENTLEGSPEGAEQGIAVVGAPEWEGIDPNWVNATGNIIRNNTVSDFSGAGVYISGNVSNTTVEGNDLVDNDLGVRIYAGYGGTPSGYTHVNNNKLSSLENEVPDYNIDATCNWWGTPVGSEIDDMVSGDVDYSTVLLNDILDPEDDDYECIDPWDGPVYNVDLDTYYSEIQAAINAAGDGNVIQVAPGTYEEAIEINVPNLTLKSTGGRDVTFIDNPDVEEEKFGISVLANMGTVTVEGFTVNNFLSGIVQGRSNREGTAFIVKNNKIIPENNDTDPALRNGIQVSGDGSQVIGNYIVGAPLTDDWASSGIQVVNANNVLVQDNSVNTANADIGISILNWDVSLIENITVENNTINGADEGIRLSSQSTNKGDIKNVTVKDNVVLDNTRSGITIFWASQAEGITITNNVTSGSTYFGFEAMDSKISDLVIEFNEITDNASSGVYIWADVELENDIIINNNDISGNGFGVISAILDSEVTIDATCNWWGTTDPEAIDAITWGKVDWSPFLDAKDGDCDGAAPVINLTTGLPYVGIQIALDEAGVGDEIFVSSGSYTGTVVSPGNIVWSYGASPGCVTVDGNYIYQSTDIIKIDIWGETPCTEHDQIDVTGELTFNRAKLDINLYNDEDGVWYNPEVDEEFVIFKYGTLTPNNFLMDFPHNYVRAKYETGHKNFSISYVDNEVILTTLEDRDIDIAINEIGCGDFEVVVIPRHNDLANSWITNLQFTIKYPLELELGDFETPGFIELELGETLPTDDYQYITFVGTDLVYEDWDQDVEQTVLTFRHDQAGIGDDYGEFTILSAEETGSSYAFYVEYLGREVTGDILTLYDNDDPRVIGLLTGCPVHNIDTDLYYYKIMDAIDGVNYPGGAEIAGVVVGETLQAATWTFEENVVIPVADVTLQPMEDNGTFTEPVIDGGGDGIVVLVTADNVTVEGFAIQNSGTTVFADALVGLSDVTGVIIDGNDISDGAIGVVISGGSGNTVTNNEITGDILRGIALVNTTGNYIGVEDDGVTAGANTIDLDFGAIAAINLSFASDNLVNNNLITTETAYGIQLAEESDNNELVNNTITVFNDADTDGNHGILLFGKDNGAGYSGIGNLIEGNIITIYADVWKYGIALRDGADETIIRGNTINSSSHGIFAGQWLDSDELITELTIENNVITANLQGIRILEDVDGVLVFENSIVTDGLGIFNSSGNEITATCNWWGSADMNFVAGKMGDDVLFAPFLVTSDEVAPSGWPNGFDPIGPCEAPLTLKVFLQGPYAGAEEMETDLTDELPATQPYNQPPWNYGGEEELPATLEDEVDWVLVELRDSNDDNYGVIERFAGLLNKDGSITAIFTETLTEFYVVVYHRNHLPVMFEEQIDVSDFTFPIDLTDGDNILDKSAINLGDGIFGMVAGDVTHNGRLAYSGQGNDRGPIIFRITEGDPNVGIGTVINDGYWFEDVLLNNQLKYTGDDNDRLLILQNIQTKVPGAFLNTRFFSPVPGVYDSSKEQYFNDGPVNIMVAGNTISIVSDKSIDNALIDNIQFTLAWKADNQAAWHALESIHSDFAVAAQGAPIVVDDIAYQVFVSATPIPVNGGLMSGHAVPVLASDLNLANHFYIAMDYVAMENNGLFYISMWGQDKTGYVESTPTDIDDVSIDGQLVVYPNPVTDGQIRVSIPDFNGQQLNMAIYDLEGRMVKQLGLRADNTELTIDIASLRGGVYLLRATNQYMQHYIRFVVLD